MLLHRLSQAFAAALVVPSCSASMRGKPCHKWSQGCSVPLATRRRDGQSVLAARRRPPADAKDDVAMGLHGNLITQRLKLNSRVALVTGAASPRLHAAAHTSEGQPRDSVNTRLDQRQGEWGWFASVRTNARAMLVSRQPGNRRAEAAHVGEPRLARPAAEPPRARQAEARALGARLRMRWARPARRWRSWTWCAPRPRRPRPSWQPRACAAWRWWPTSRAPLTASGAPRALNTLKPVVPLPFPFWACTSHMQAGQAGSPLHAALASMRRARSWRHAIDTGV
jgi:hypothetical protein